MREDESSRCYLQYYAEESITLCTHCHRDTFPWTIRYHRMALEFELYLMSFSPLYKGYLFVSVKDRFLFHRVKKINKNVLTRDWVIQSCLDHSDTWYDSLII